MIKIQFKNGIIELPDGEFDYLYLDNGRCLVLINLGKSPEINEKILGIYNSVCEIAGFMNVWHFHAQGDNWLQINKEVIQSIEKIIYGNTELH